MNINYNEYVSLAEIKQMGVDVESFMSEETAQDLAAFGVGGLFHKENFVKLLNGELSNPLIPMDYTDIEEQINFWDETNKNCAQEVVPLREELDRVIFQAETPDVTANLAEHINISRANDEIKGLHLLGERYMNWKCELQDRELQLYDEVDF